MTEPSKPTALEDIWIVLFFVLIAALASPALRPALVDDAFIYLRVAENLASGSGMVYNTGEYVNAATSPFYTLMLAAFSWVTGPGPHNLLVAYFIGLAGIPIVLYLAFRKENRLLAFFLALAAMSETVLLKSAGLEISCFLFALLAAAHFFQSERYVACGILCGIFALMRPEGVALIVIICLFHLFMHRRMAWTSLLVFVSIVIPWVIFSQLYFDSVIPNSVIVKSAQSNLLVSESHSGWLNEFLKQPSLPWITFPLSILGLLCIGRDLFRGRTFGAVVVIFALIQVTVYSFMNAPFYFWYFAVGNLMITVCVVIALFRGTKWLMFRWSQRSFVNTHLNRKPSALIRLITVGVPIAVYCIASPFTWPSPYRLAEEYSKVGSWIAERTDPNTEVACVEIGYIGYFSRRTVCDIAGLLHAKAAAHIRKNEMSWWFTTHTPEVVVMHRSPWLGEPRLRSWETSLLERFQKEYRIVKKLDHVIVYSKRPPRSKAGDAPDQVSSLNGNGLISTGRQHRTEPKTRVKKSLELN